MTIYASSHLLVNGAPTPGAGFVRASDLDTANNPPALDENGAITGTIISRHGTAAEIDAITLAAGEYAFTTDTREVRVGDGATAGGLFIASRGVDVSYEGSNDIAESTAYTALGPTVPYAANALYEVMAGMRLVDAGASSNWRFRLYGSTNWKGRPASFSSAMIPYQLYRYRSEYNDGVVESGDAWSPLGLATVALPRIPQTAFLAAAGKSQVDVWLEARVRTDSAGEFSLRFGQNVSSVSALSVAWAMTVRRVM